MTSAPSVVTEVYTSTNGAGSAVTITQAVVNPTLEPNNNSSAEPSFFKNTGAVVGVFVVVGLATASIMLLILFAIRRRQRMRRIEQDTEVEAAVAAAGFNRALLDDDNDNGHDRSHRTRSQFSSEMGQRGSLLGYGLGGSGSLPTSGRPVSGAFDDYPRDDHGFNPYADYPAEHQVSGNVQGYVPARTASPPPGAERPGLPGIGVDELSPSREGRRSSYGHTPTYSAGSFEPLLANHNQNALERGAHAPPTPPPRNPRRLVDASGDPLDSTALCDSNGYSTDVSTDNRLDPGMQRRTRSDSLGSVDLRDEEDYTRPVLKASGFIFSVPHPD
ncbi:hypothetical protein F5I97DRAFT_1813709 [Phlebopus sp. FC_14]|nr:hypothetical protein F5I97DRAFT_1813709 [Phlebopus sp. FC_14]